MYGWVRAINILWNLHVHKVMIENALYKQRPEGRYELLLDTDELHMCSTIIMYSVDINSYCAYYLTIRPGRKYVP